MSEDVFTHLGVAVILVNLKKMDTYELTPVKDRLFQEKMKSSESPIFHDWMCRQLSRKANLHGRCVRQKSSCYPKRLLAQNSSLMMKIQGKTSNFICKAVCKIHTKSVHAEMLKIMCINKVMRFIKPCVRTPPGKLPFIHHSPHISASASIMQHYT